MPPIVALVGAEYEENLSLRYLAAAIAPAPASRSEIVAFQRRRRRRRGSSDRSSPRARSSSGISCPFQVRARELLAVPGELRRAGYRGHVCVGGHFATFEYENLLARLSAPSTRSSGTRGSRPSVELC